MSGDGRLMISAAASGAEVPATGLAIDFVTCEALVFCDKRRVATIKVCFGRASAVALLALIHAGRPAQERMRHGQPLCVGVRRRRSAGAKFQKVLCRMLL